MPEARLPLISTPENRGDTPDRDAKIINGFIEKELDGDIWAIKRPGMIP